MKNLEERGYLLTEQVNPNSQDLDLLSSLELVDVFNREDARTVEAIATARTQLAEAIDRTAKALRQGGRLFYVGAGTSGRLGVLDAAECPPTFCTSPEMVQGIIAGGAGALVRSSEDLEDKDEDGISAIATRHITHLDVVVGITAGGTTPFVHGAIQAARQRGATTILIACVPAEQVTIDADLDIRLLVGPEVLAGSTRLKAGTVTKMALNILSTGVMVQLGKVYGNRMVDVAITNKKLRDRALRILHDLTGLDREEASFLLEQSGRSVKLSLLIHWTGLNREEADVLLVQHHGNLRQAVQAIRTMTQSNSDIINLLKQASEGLLYMSESDYPFEVFLWESQDKKALTTEKLIQQTGHSQDTPIEVVKIEDFFQPLLQEYDWHGSEEKEIVSKYKHLVETLKQNLDDIHVYRLGKIEIDVYIVGTTKTGDRAGLSTKAIET